MNFWSLNNILEFPDLNLNPENQLLRQPDVSGQLRLAEVKPDVWGPHVSDRGVKQG